MSVYLLNLGFNRTDPSSASDGRFLDFTQPSSSANYKITSKAWFQAPSSWTWDGGAIDLSNWTLKWHDSQQPLSVLNEDTIILRIFNGETNSTPGLRFNCVFGRKKGAGTQSPPGDGTLATPFQLNGNPCSVFATWKSTDSLDTPLSDGSWVYDLGSVVNTPTSNSVGRYEFNVGVTVTDSPSSWSGAVYTFGHDPEMDVGSGPMPEPRPQPRPV